MRFTKVTVLRRQQAGFTLIELLVTLAIVSFALVLVVGYKPPWSRALGLRGAAAEIVDGLRVARSRAIAQNRATRFEIDLNGHRFQIDSDPVRQLPTSLGLAMLTITGERQGSNTGSIRFNPDGSSTGGRISLADGGRAITIGVDWLTGRVSGTDVR
jgi:general secretion pathway protein H